MGTLPTADIPVQHAEPAGACIRAPLPEQRAPLLTVGDLSKRRRCSDATTWRHVKAGLLPPPIKIGGLTRWIPEEVEAAIEAAKVARGAA
jgi:predicted DNA-binding transcriptional regulator AlpA